MLFKDDIHSIFIGSLKDGEITFTFPPFKTDKLITVELVAYTAQEVKVKKIQIMLKQFNGDVMSIQSDVRRFQPSQVTHSFF